MSEKATQQINIKVNELDLKVIDEKARRYGVSRSCLMKMFALNGELSINICKKITMPIS
jgi:hypothetical protein